MSKALQILKQFWGYESFRNPQNEIIDVIQEKKDALVILPTGGGKSLCYQVPALMNEGICIVVSPLIALMKDQVEQLQKRGIKASAVFSALSRHEIDIALDNAAYGDIKLLYVSPERLETDIFKARVQKMNVNLIAIDEAHCISQWGHDFRPAYRKISTLRELLPDVPMVALTASATTEVQEDIIEQLTLKEPVVFKKSFQRTNLSFVTRKVENKGAKLLEVIAKLGGTGIVYARSRKKTKEIAKHLTKNGYDATYYNAGLSPEERHIRQEAWMRGATQIMVCTNAFGMGIDKANVRFVIHWDVPDSLEAYYQEAGRAGRDGKMAYAVMLYNVANLSSLKNGSIQKFPELDIIKNTYNGICNYLKVAVGSGLMMSFDFDIMKFVKLFKLSLITTYNVIRILEQEGYWLTSESIYLPSRIKFVINKQDIYKFQVENERYDRLIQLLLRTYGGVLDYYIIINEGYLADRLKLTKVQFVQALNQLKAKNIINYIPYKSNPTLTLLKNRLADRSVILDRDFWLQRKKVYDQQAAAMIHYCSSNLKCKQQIISEYFGEMEAPECGLCNVCIERKSKKLNDTLVETIKEDLVQRLSNNITLSFAEIVEGKEFYESKNYRKAIRVLLDEEVVVLTDDKKIRLNQ